MHNANLFSLLLVAAAVVALQTGVSADACSCAAARNKWSLEHRGGGSGGGGGSAPPPPVDATEFGAPELAGFAPLAELRRILTVWLWSAAALGLVAGSVAALPGVGPAGWLWDDAQAARVCRVAGLPPLPPRDLGRVMALALALGLLWVGAFYTRDDAVDRTRALRPGGTGWFADWHSDTGRCIELRDPADVLGAACRASPLVQQRWGELTDSLPRYGEMSYWGFVMVGIPLIAIFTGAYVLAVYTLDTDRPRPGELPPPPRPPPPPPPPDAGADLSDLSDLSDVEDAPDAGGALPAAADVAPDADAGAPDADAGAPDAGADAERGGQPGVAVVAAAAARRRRAAAALWVLGWALYAALFVPPVWAEMAAYADAYPGDGCAAVFCVHDVLHNRTADEVRRNWSGAGAMAMAANGLAMLPLLFVPCFAVAHAAVRAARGALRRRAARARARKEAEARAKARAHELATIGPMQLRLLSGDCYLVPWPADRVDDGFELRGHALRLVPGLVAATGSAVQPVAAAVPGAAPRVVAACELLEPGTARRLNRVDGRTLDRFAAGKQPPVALVRILEPGERDEPGGGHRPAEAASQLCPCLPATRVAPQP